MDAILYINRTGWQWQNDGTWEKVHDAFVVCVRKAMGKQSTPSASTTESGGEQRGYDAIKKISGRKRHIIVHAASIQDQDGAK